MLSSVNRLKSMRGSCLVSDKNCPAPQESQRGGGQLKRVTPLAVARGNLKLVRNGGVEWHHRLRITAVE